jgi:hypothetical protein
MSQHPVFRSASWKKIAGLCLLALIVFGIGWKASSVLAQGGAGSEPGATAVPPAGTAAQERALPVRSAQSGSNGLSKAMPGLPLTAAPAAPNLWPTNWYTMVGAAFQPQDSTITYNYGFGGCIHPTSYGSWRASVNIPDGSVIKYIYITYRNTVDSTASSYWLTSYRYDATINDLITMTSRPGSVSGAGVFSDLSTEITRTVDNLGYGYAFVWDGSATQDLCAMLVGYIPPARYYSMLPLVVR